MASIYHKIVQYIDAHIKEEITITDIADITGYSVNHIYKIFKVYSPHPIMEYIRRKKLYSAASEIYTGRKLFDIALDYGYGTPAGFYKAFKSIFGCSPSEYKNNIQKEGITMLINNVKNIEELNEVLCSFKNIHQDHPITNTPSDSDEKFSQNWWHKQFDKTPDLLLYAKDGEKICAVTLGFANGGSVTIHEGVLAEYKCKGIFEALFIELEKRAKTLGYSSIALGINEGEEEFYAKLGYVGKTLIQSEKYSIDDLKAFNERYGNYEITRSGVYEGTINQLWLDISLLDKNLKQKYEKEVGDCWVQVIVNKTL